MLIFGTFLGGALHHPLWRTVVWLACHQMVKSQPSVLSLWKALNLGCLKVSIFRPTGHYGSACSANTHLAYVNCQKWGLEILPKLPEDQK